MRREEKAKSGKKSSKAQMPEVKETYSSRYKGKDNKSRGNIESVKPTYPSRYK